MLSLNGRKQRINNFVAQSWLGRFFQLERSSSGGARRDAKFLAEINAGLATFFAMVRLRDCCPYHTNNPRPTSSVSTHRLSPVCYRTSRIRNTSFDNATETGGTCVCKSATDATCATDAAYLQCIGEVKQDLVTATAALAALSSVAMGVFANLPVALA